MYKKNLLLTSILMCFLIVSINLYAKDKDLIFYMSFDTMVGDKVQDDSGNGSLGTLKGDAKIVKNGKYGSAISLSGAGHIDCGNNPILNQEFAGLTIEAWVNPAMLVPESMIVGKWAWTVAGDHIGLFMFNGKGLIAVADGVTSEQGFVGQKAVKENTWSHVAATWNSKDFSHQIYINGELDSVGKQTGKGINTKSNETLKIGAQITGTARYFNGLIDDVAIYGRILTEEEIKADMKGLAPVDYFGKLLDTWAKIKIQN
ncbi:MAG: LamG domain-containing protein [bacterium]